MTWFLRNWDQVAVALGQHVTIVLTALAIASVIALPVGIVAARRARVYAFAITVAGFLYTIPTLAFLALLIPWSGSEERTRSLRWSRSHSSC
jgi:osmoprotectant transport system permease protein